MTPPDEVKADAESSRTRKSLDSRHPRRCNCRVLSSEKQTCSARLVHHIEIEMVRHPLNLMVQAFLNNVLLQ